MNRKWFMRIGILLQAVLPLACASASKAELPGEAGEAIQISFVHIEGGTFQMGSSDSANDDEKPIHTVTVDSFNMGMYPVTQKEWMSVMGNNPSSFKGDNRPVETVSWYEAVRFCNKLSQMEGLKPAYTINGTNVTWDRNADGYRLPTEAEWEYAARGGHSAPRIYLYSGSNDADAVAWYTWNSGMSTQEIGALKPNWLDLYDMSGNTWEWCWDWYDATYYTYSPQNNPEGASSGPGRVFRGGSYGFPPPYLRITYRDYGPPGSKDDDMGFRLVRP